jgi:SulP family sulfate permease
MQIKLFEGLRPFRRQQILPNAIAGITLASMNIPQVLGYARIAGMPIVTGLYTVLLPIIGFAIFGSSRHLVVAADSATAAIFSSSLSKMATPASEHYLALVAMLTLLTAIFLLVARLFKLGFLADFISRTVLVGFLTGVGIQVCVAMFGDILALPIAARHPLPQIVEIFENVSLLHWPTLALSLGVIASILLGRRFLSSVPISLIAVVVTIAASFKFHWLESGIATIGFIPAGLPILHFSELSWKEIYALLPIAAACFVMIIAQSAATARGVAVRHHEIVDENEDILGLAVANAAAAFSGAFVVNGSPTQTKMAEESGAKNQIAQVVFAGVVLIVLLFLTGFLQYLPRCVLASIVFTIAVGMIDLKTLRAILEESPGEFYLAALTAVGVIAVGVEQGILLAFVLSLFRHVRHSYRPHTTMLLADATGSWETSPALPGKETAAGLIVYRFGADLFYANDSRFVLEVQTLIRAAPIPIRCFIIDAGAITDMDYSAARSLRDLFEELQQQNILVIFGRVSSYLRADMDRHQLTAVIGEKQIFRTLHEAIASAGFAPA